MNKELSLEERKKEWVKKHVNPDGPMSDEWWEDDVRK